MIYGRRGFFSFFFSFFWGGEGNKWDKLAGWEDLVWSSSSLKVFDDRYSIYKAHCIHCGYALCHSHLKVYQSNTPYWEGCRSELVFFLSPPFQFLVFKSLNPAFSLLRGLLFDA